MAKGPSGKKTSTSFDKDVAIYNGVMDRIITHERKVSKKKTNDVDEYGRVIEEIGGRNSDVLGLKRVRIRDEKIKLPPERKSPNNDMYTVIEFSVPSTRGVRPMTEDGRTSFHFSHSSVSKTRKEVQNEKGQINRPGAARDHNKYIERGSAVAIAAEAEKDAAAIALEIARDGDNTGIEIDPTTSATQSPTADPAPLNKEDNPNGRSTSNALLARVARVALKIHESYFGDAAAGEPAGAISSLRDVPSLGMVRHAEEVEMSLLGAETYVLGREGGSGDELRRTGDGDRSTGGGGLDENPFVDSAAKHGAYVERQEALARLDDGTRVLFTNISNDPVERGQVWDKIEAFEVDPGPDKIAVSVGRTPEFWAAVLAHPDCPEDVRAGILGARPDKEYSFPVEKREEVQTFFAGQPGYDFDSPQVRYPESRGGRIQYRVIGELPHDTSTAERTSILREFTKEFEDRKLPYVAVMHAPDHTNDHRNWHFHLVYYDRPISKMADSRWDFEVGKQYDDGHRHIRTHYPHRQKKLDEVNRPQWIPMLRKRLAAITNDHLEIAKIDRRLDARKYTEMGIHREPQEHLGTEMATLEAMGVVTLKGGDNAKKDWDELLARIAQSRERAMRKTEVQADKLEARITTSNLPQSAMRSARVQVHSWRQSQDEANEYKFMADNIGRRHDRMLSRAEKTLETCDKKIAAAKAQTRLGPQKNLDKLADRKKQAEAFISAVKLQTQHDELIAKDYEIKTGHMQGIADSRLAVVELIVGAGSKSADEFIARVREMTRDTDAEIDAAAAAKKAGALAAAKAAAVDTDARQATTRRKLSQAEMDAFVQSIMDSKRRVERHGRQIIPLGLSPDEMDITQALNYSAISNRLLGVKKVQDGLIEEIIVQIDKDPTVISRRYVSELPRLEFFSKQPRLMQAFRNYSTDPQLNEAARKAMAENDHRAAEKAKGITAPEATVEPKIEALASSRERSVLSAKVINEAFDLMAHEPIRMEAIDGKVRPEPSLLRVYGLTEADIDNEPSQRRLRAMKAAQDREFNRLEGYARSRPDKIVLSNGRYDLAKDAPADLLFIANKWYDDTLLQGSLQRITIADKARQERAITTTIADFPSGSGFVVDANRPVPANNKTPADIAATAGDARRVVERNRIELARQDAGKKAEASARQLARKNPSGQVLPTSALDADPRSMAAAIMSECLTRN